MARPRVALALLVAVAAGAPGCGGETKTVTRTVTNGGASTTPAFIVDVLGKRSEQPSEFTFSVNGDLVAKDLRWQDWGQDTATASATFVFNAAPHNHPPTGHGRVLGARPR